MSYKEKNKDRYNENRKRYRAKIRQIINDLKKVGCAMCGESEPCCLDFHHLRDKEFVIAGATDVSTEKLFNEVDKCIILCANCHRKLHAGKIAI